MFDPFEYHKPTDEQLERIAAIRKGYFALLEIVNANTKPGPVCGRQAALAKTALEESAMWATKAIAFEGQEP